jgi:hypothetical protein
MALSTKTRARVTVALARRDAAKELCDAVDAGGNTPAADVAAVVTANATDLATAEALANQLKITVNAILANLKTAGLMS